MRTRHSIYPKHIALNLFRASGFLASLAILSANSSAIAGQEAWSSESGKTVFFGPLINTCGSSSDGGFRLESSSYETEYQGVQYTGNFWPQNVLTGCEANQETRIVGYFEERNQARNEWCRGSLQLSFDGDRGQATWLNVEAVPDYQCLTLIHPTLTGMDGDS